jgi:pyridoxal phosphate enzyme (YggS family)
MEMSESQLETRLSQNLSEVRGRIGAAARRAGRAPADISLVGVTKYAGPLVARKLFEAGLTAFGESRPQELWHKSEALADLPIHWHLIGHLQRNKVRRTLPLVTLIHSVDSSRLFDEVSREGIAQGRTADVLLEVNISGDAAKHGLAPLEVEPLLAHAAVASGVKILGLMAMASLEGSNDRARRDFAALRELRDRLAPSCPPGVDLRELSMGMSGDYEVAIEEGATIVRVGSALVEGTC